LVVFFGPVVNSKWLDDLGMEYPETIADWETMLTRFKNEKGATAPLTYEPALLESNNSTFVGAFGVNFDFYLDDNGQIQFGPIQPGYRRFLETFQRWYANGLIDPNIESMNREQTTFKMTTGQAGASFGFAASRLGVWLSAVQDNPEIDFTGTKYPVLNRGDIPMFSQMDFPLQGNIGTAHISTAAEDVEGILKLLDYGYSEEGNMFYNFGIEGVSYEMIDGYPTYTDLLMNDPNLPRAAMFGQYLRSSSNGPFVQRREYFEQYGYQFPQQEVALKNWAVTNVMNHKLPPISPTPEESAELATIMSDINTYRDEMRTKYIMGIENLNTFDTYVRNIQNMGLDRAIEIYTGALRRFNAR
jgi:putative aldouronate transport system substrate-binding protein